MKKISYEKFTIITIAILVAAFVTVLVNGAIMIHDPSWQLPGLIFLGIVTFFAIGQFIVWYRRYRREEAGEDDEGDLDVQS